MYTIGGRCGGVEFAVKCRFVAGFLGFIFDHVVEVKKKIKCNCVILQFIFFITTNKCKLLEINCSIKKPSILLLNTTYISHTSALDWLLLGTTF